MKNITQSVKEYYGEKLQSSDDLKTNACCTDTQLPKFVKDALKQVHREVLTRYYGCGLIAPEALEGCRILDLGSGAGRDAYVLAQLVGESGEVVGVDMTKAQLEVANKYLDWHRSRFGYRTSNVRFVEGELEKLHTLGLEPSTFDVIVSNCVINLCTDKNAVLKAAKSLLKPGGEMYFADVYADRRVPDALRADPVLYGECLSGALYINDFEDLVRDVGFIDPRIVTARPLTIDNPEIEKKVGDIKFFSVTYRLFNIDSLERRCEDYGQTVKYKGSIPDNPMSFVLDNHHEIKTDDIFPVCGNTYQLLYQSRLKSHFEFRGDFSTHYGVFAGCGGILPELDKSMDCGCGSALDATCCTPSAPAAASTSARVQISQLKELWFHTGTDCNLSCQGCLEGSGPDIDRIDLLSVADAVPFIDEGRKHNVAQFSFTGGEPFVNPDFIGMLTYASRFKPCLVLTNATTPMKEQLSGLKPLRHAPFPISFRVSIDYPDPNEHDAIRGKGMFDEAIDGLKQLEAMGFDCSIARRETPGENRAQVEAAYKNMLRAHGFDPDKKIISFPDLLTPRSHPNGIPTITDGCLQSFNGSTGFMCQSSRMVVKKNGVLTVYACTLVDDDESFALGSRLADSLQAHVHLTHHRCYSCYKSGASCSEL